MHRSAIRLFQALLKMIISQNILFFNPKFCDYFHIPEFGLGEENTVGSFPLKSSSAFRLKSVAAKSRLLIIV